MKRKNPRQQEVALLHVHASSHMWANSGTALVPGMLNIYLCSLPGRIHQSAGSTRPSANVASLPALAPLKPARPAANARGAAAAAGTGHQVAPVGRTRSARGVPPLLDPSEPSSMSPKVRADASLNQPSCCSAPSSPSLREINLTNVPRSPPRSFGNEA